jgi:threonine synthase
LYKFSGSVLAAIGKDTNADEFGLVDELAEVSKIPVPASLAALKDKEVRFTKVIDKADMKDYIYSALGI